MEKSSGKNVAMENIPSDDGKGDQPAATGDSVSGVPTESIPSVDAEGVEQSVSTGGSNFSKSTQSTQRSDGAVNTKPPYVASKTSKRTRSHEETLASNHVSSFSDGNTEVQGRSSKRPKTSKLAWHDAKTSKRTRSHEETLDSNHASAIGDGNTEIGKVKGSHKRPKTSKLASPNDSGSDSDWGFEDGSQLMLENDLSSSAGSSPRKRKASDCSLLLSSDDDEDGEVVPQNQDDSLLYSDSNDEAGKAVKSKDTRGGLKNTCVGRKYQNSLHDYGYSSLDSDSDDEDGEVGDRKKSTGKFKSTGEEPELNKPPAPTKRPPKPTGAKRRCVAELRSAKMTLSKDAVSFEVDGVETLDGTDELFGKWVNNAIPLVTAQEKVRQKGALKREMVRQATIRQTVELEKSKHQLARDEFEFKKSTQRQIPQLQRTGRYSRRPPNKGSAQWYEVKFVYVPGSLDNLPRVGQFRQFLKHVCDQGFALEQPSGWAYIGGEFCHVTFKCPCRCLVEKDLNLELTGPVYGVSVRVVIDKLEQDVPGMLKCKLEFPGKEHLKYHRKQDGTQGNPLQLADLATVTEDANENA